MNHDDFWERLSDDVLDLDDGADSTLRGWYERLFSHVESKYGFEIELEVAPMRDAPPAPAEVGEG